MTDRMPGLLGSWSGRLDLQYADRAVLAEEQIRRLAAHIALIGEKSPYYRERFLASGISPADFHALGDLSRFPLTSKEDLKNREADFLAVPSDRIADVCLTSATTGTPTRMLQTENDLLRLAWNEEAAFGMAGLGRGDTLMVTAAVDRCFMAGLAYFLGGIALGCRMVRCGSGSPAQIWELVKTTAPTALVGVPSLLLKTALYAREAGDDPSRAGVSKVIAIGETIRDENLDLLETARRIETLWGAGIHSTYASSEMASTYIECPHRRGGHIRPELIYTEILDEAGRPAAPGTRGEVVVTPLGVTGMPLFRFRTGDISFLMDEPCPCGRTTPRIGPVLGRKDQMLKYRGTTIFPGTLLGAVEGTPGIVGGCVEALRHDDGTDRVVLHLALERPDAVPEERIRDLLRARARVVPEIRLITPALYEELSTASGKRKRVQFIDSRG